MKIKIPPNLRKQVYLALKDGQRARWSLEENAWNVMLDGLLPGFEGDQEILELVAWYARDTPWVSRRNLAARVLLAAGHPDGIRYLTYNTLSIHPVIGEGQPQESGWVDGWLLEKAKFLTEPCIDLLLADVAEPPHWFHGDLLASAPPHLVVPKLQKLLYSGQDMALLQAAYALALLGYRDGRPALLAAVETGNFRALKIALIALSHDPDDQERQLIQRVAEGTHPILNIIRQAKVWPEYPGSTPYDERTVQRYCCFAQQRWAIAEKKQSFCDLFLHDYGKDYLPDWIDSKIDWIRRVPWPKAYTAKFLKTNTPLGWTHGADLLWEFATEEDRQALASYQRQIMADVLARVPESNWPALTKTISAEARRLPGSFCVLDDWEYSYFPGVEIHWEYEDYLLAVTDWILRPEVYRVGLRDKSPWNIL